MMREQERSPGSAGVRPAPVFIAGRGMVNSRRDARGPRLLGFFPGQSFVLLAAATLLLQAACTVGPTYERPKAEVPPAFKETPPPGWKESQPRDEISKGDWWTVFGDPVLDDLEKEEKQKQQASG